MRLPAVVMKVLYAALHVAKACCLILYAGVRRYATLTVAQACCATCGVEPDPNLPAFGVMSHICLHASTIAQGPCQLVGATPPASLE